MSIQGNINKGLLGMAVIASLENINKTIQDNGFNDYNELCKAINTLEIEIAKKEDEGKSAKKMSELLSKYKDIKQQYDIAIKEKEEEKKRNKLFGSVLAISFSIIFAIVMIVIVASI